MVFGVLCLIVGGLSGMKNAMEAGLALAGSEGLEQMVSMAEGMGQTLTPSQRENFDVQIKSHRKPVYRIGQGIESIGSAVMALVLIAAGIGLLRGRAWSLKLARWWAFYAIPAAGVSVILSVRYVLPEMPDASVGGGMINGAFMLAVLWALPVLLLKQLPIEPVKNYLAAREAQRSGTAARVGTQPIFHRTSSADPMPSPRDTTSPPPEPQATSQPADTTWRDDPWNDPGSQ